LGEKFACGEEIDFGLSVLDASITQAVETADN
jgi:hypothetical protein